jgi:hypothetical protein
LKSLKILAGIIGLAVVLPTIGIFGYWLFGRWQSYRIVSSGQLVIDQETHSWIVDPGESVKIEMFVRNKSHRDFSGTVHFELHFSTSEIEGTYLKEVEKILTPDVEAEILPEFKDAKSPKARAIFAYFKRRRKLLPGMNVETVSNVEKDVYKISFRKFIRLKGGELSKIVHEQELPPIEGGYDLSVKIAGVE